MGCDPVLRYMLTGHLFGLVLDIALLFTNSKIKLVDWIIQIGHVRLFRVFPTRVLAFYFKNPGCIPTCTITCFISTLG